MGQTLGISETVGVVAMVSLTVAGASTVYLTTSETIENTDADVDLQVSNLEPISCYHQGGESTVTLQNSGEERENLNKLVTKVDKEPIQVSTSDPIVDSGENVQITINRVVEPSQAVKFIPGKTSSVDEDSNRYKFYPCSNLVEPPEYAVWAYRIFENGTTDPGTSTNPGTSTTDPDSSKFQRLTIDRTSVRPYDGDLCLGQDCSGKGLNTDFDSTNDYLNVGGDKVNGTLSVQELYTEGDVCFGKGCSVNRGNYGLFVSEEYPFINGTLDTDGIEAQKTCLGDGCSK